MRFLKAFNLSTILSVIPSVRPSLINKTPLCRDCKFFIANNRECGKFGDIDLVTGEKSYTYARQVRNDENKCGQEAKHFEKNNYKFITVPYYLLSGVYFPILVGIFIPYIFINLFVILMK